ncbi:MAG: Glu/Leu/Phe/Val dehydrogenase dimerization domain-containing protein [Alphaproteobacteria bacterium]|jgi:leucine dehydrogenase|nr:Glu/Leu/Phe/Val dehydrogenase dimerization domain-containing protein [Alphaproteobacteria bacterium]
MPVSQSPSFRGHEQVVFCYDAEVGLKAIIAIHDTTLGPALGGLRMWNYTSEIDALEDVLRLSRGMTYKAAMADLDFGGGKAVIIGDAKTQKTEPLLERFGEFVDGLGGRYITAEDVGTSPRDLAIVRRRTRYAAGFDDGGSGDPSPVTAWGVFNGIRAAVSERLNRPNLAGTVVAVQGLGHVGEHLLRFLHEADARLVVADVDPERVSRAVARYGAVPTTPGEIYEVAADVFAPCALGAVLNDETIPRLRAAVVAGAANNQLAEDRHGEILAERDILYAPDYVINAGGIININYEGPNYDAQAAMDHAARIHDTLAQVFDVAERERAPTNMVADQMAEARIAAAKAEKQGTALKLAG